MIKDITTVFLDWDNTLSDFHMSESAALRNTFDECGLILTPQMRERYGKINAYYWKLFDKKQLKKDDVFILRFRQFFEEYGIDFDPAVFNVRYLHSLSCEAPLFDGAKELCEFLHSRYSVYITTNGDAKGQFKRIEKSGLLNYFNGIFVSDAVGVGKPSREYWKYVFDHIDEKDPSRTVIVGDSLTSDMRSGTDIGMKTCWVNLYDDIPYEKFDYTVTSTKEIIRIFRE